jgi:hypothetical protein
MTQRIDGVLRRSTATGPVPSPGRPNLRNTRAALAGVSGALLVTEPGANPAATRQRLHTFTVLLGGINVAIASALGMVLLAVVGR